MGKTLLLTDLYRPIRPEIAGVEEFLNGFLRLDSDPIRELIRYLGFTWGKMFRPALVLFSGRSVGEVGEDHVRLGVAIELIHTATLIHDDILDEADLRRHRRAIHHVFGTQACVLFGDYLFSRAFNLITSFEDPVVPRTVTQATDRICMGEILQTLEQSNLGLLREKYLEIIRLKTASLYATACRLGAYLSGASPEVCDRLFEYGEAVGVAFQIVDDCLDLLGEEGVVGKSLGRDLKKGRMTLPVIHLLEVGRSEARRLVEGHVNGASEAGDGAAVRAGLRALLDSTGAAERAHEEAGRYIERAKETARGLPDLKRLDELLDLADFALERRH